MDESTLHILMCRIPTKSCQGLSYVFAIACRYEKKVAGNDYRWQLLLQCFTILFYIM